MFFIHKTDGEVKSKEEKMYRKKANLYKKHHYGKQRSFDSPLHQKRNTKKSSSVCVSHSILRVSATLSLCSKSLSHCFL